MSSQNLSGTGTSPSGAGSQAPANSDALYLAFDSYPWTKDPSFMPGLLAILGPSASSGSAPASDPEDLALHARIFYYARSVGVAVDFAAYRAWLAAHPAHAPPVVVPADVTAAFQRRKQEQQQEEEQQQPGRPDWQRAAPRRELFVDQDDGSKEIEAAAGVAGGQEEARYPLKFAEILELLQAGKSVPGIREIPDTVVRDPAAIPFGQLSRPKKPWESVDTEMRGPRWAVDGSNVFPEYSIDQEFPPLEDHGASGS